MKESAFRFGEPKLTGLRLLVDPGTDHTHDLENAQFVISSDVRSVSRTESYVSLRVSMGQESGPWYVCGEIQCLVSWPEGTPWEDAVRILKHNVPAMLLSYLRPCIAQITAASPMQAVHLPFVDFRPEEGAGGNSSASPSARAGDPDQRRMQEDAPLDAATGTVYRDVESCQKEQCLKTHNHSIVVIRDTFSACPNRFLVYFDTRWGCDLFINYKQNINNESFITEHLSADLKLPPKSISLSFRSKQIHEKYSVSAKENKVYCHLFYEASIRNFPDVLKQDSFTIDERAYRWRSLADMEQDAEIQEKNADILAMVKKLF